MELDDAILICDRCGHGREVCTFCAPQEWTVFKMICNCGLYEHGEHRIDCEIVRDEAAHAAYGAHAVTDAETEHGQQTVWSKADDEALEELLGE
jgi:hypothetical protein